MNILGSSKVHKKEVYSLWVILDHPVYGGEKECYSRKPAKTGFCQKFSWKIRHLLLNPEFLLYLYVDLL